MENISSKEAVSFFVNEMNAIGNDLEMKNSNFANPHGLSNQFNVSCCFDLSILTTQALKISIFKEIVRSKLYRCKITNNGVERDSVWENTNKLLNREDCIGVKTGVTPSAGPCMAVGFENNSRITLVILLRSQNMEQRFNEAVHLYEYVKRREG